VNSPSDNEEVPVLQKHPASSFAFRILLCLGILLGSTAAGRGQEQKLGDVSDGNRSLPVHVIELLDEDGALIDPHASNPLPFSLRQT